MFAADLMYLYEIVFMEQKQDYISKLSWLLFDIGCTFFFLKFVHVCT